MAHARGILRVFGRKRRPRDDEEDRWRERVVGTMLQKLSPRLRQDEAERSQAPRPGGPIPTRGVDRRR